MMERLPVGVRQALAVGLLLGAIGIVLAVAVLPLAGYVGGLRSGIDEQRALLGRFTAFTANSGEVQRLAQQSDDALRTGIFLTGDTDALRAASLQALLTKITQAQGVRLRSSRTLAPTERDGLRFIGIQIELDTGITQLQAIIAAIEAQRPYLFIQSLQIAPHDMHGDGSEELKVRIGIVGAVPATGGKGERDAS